MNLRRKIGNYRTVILVCSMMVTSSVFMLGNMLNQLASEADTQGDGEPVQIPLDTHLRSIRNYELKPREKFKILQILQQPKDHAEFKFNVEQKDTAEKVGDNIGKVNQNGESYVYHDYDDDNSEESNENPVFQPGDFSDVVAFKKPPFRYAEIKKATNRIKNNTFTGVTRKGRKKTVQKGKKILSTIQPGHLVNQPYTEGIYWTKNVEDTVPKGKTERDTRKLLNYIRHQPVRYLEPPEWNKCGRPLNGIVTLMDGSVMCARYRTPHHRFILGEVISFHLSHMLGMDNVPAVVLSWVNQSEPQWRGVNYTSLQWQSNQMVALIDWIPDLNIHGSHVAIPDLLLKAYLNKTSLTSSVLSRYQLSEEYLSQLFQWGDMIIFDYLTGNYDRFASMQDAADKDKKPSILTEHVRNLKKSAKTGKFWLIDNESGLFDAYELLYLERNHRFIHFHKTMLQTMCVFHKDFVMNLKKLASSRRPELAVLDFAGSQENLIYHIPRDSKDKSFNLFQEKFPVRLKEVLDWIQECESQNSL